MTDAAFWQKKIIQLFHDPPVKVFWLFRRGGHAKKAREWLDRFANSSSTWRRFRSSVPDWVSTGADRPVLGSRETRVDWWTAPVTTHPLDEMKLEWEDWDEEAFAQTVIAALETHKFQDWNDAEELKRKFLWLWRSLPEELMQAHGPLWSVLPADSRIPDHSIWDHLRMASAYAGASNHPHFFVFAIGPVQTFINQARTSRDLWIGSYLLADLTWAAMLPIVEAYGPDAILYPSLFGNPLADQWLYDHYHGVLPSQIQRAYTRSSMLPHKFVALLPSCAIESNSPEYLVERCRQAVKERWMELGREVQRFLVGKVGSGPWTTIWNRQLSNGPACRWIAVPWKTVRSRDAGFHGWFPSEVWEHYEQTRQVYEKTHARYLRAERGFDYALTHHKAQVVYRARKAIADFLQAEERGIKCSICGEREVLHNRADGGESDVQTLRNAARAFWAHRALDPDQEGRERLCGVCAFKRFLTEAGTALNTRWAEPRTAAWGKAPFPSTSTIAALPFLLQVVEHANKLLDKIAAFVDAFNQTELSRTLHLSGLPALEKRVNDSQHNHLLKRMFEADAERGAGIDAEYLFPEIWQAKIRDARAKGRPSAALANGARAAEELVNAVTQTACIDPPSRHFALLMMDGDHMGRLLLGDPQIVRAIWKEVLHPDAVGKIRNRFAQTGWPDLLQKTRVIGPAVHGFITRALAHFAYEIVPWLVEDKHRARLIYVGGDDVLALASPESVLNLAQDLQDHFSASFLTGDRTQGYERLKKGAGPTSGRIIPMLGSHASLSAAIVIAHHKTPLRPLIHHARVLLEKTAKQQLGRRAFALSLFTRSGEKVTFGAQWRTEEGMKVLDDLIEVKKAFQRKQLPGGYPYRLREMIPALVAAAGNPDWCIALLQHPLAKSRSQNVALDSLFAVERLIRQGQRFAAINDLDEATAIHPLLLARFLGLQLAQAGGE